MTKNYIVNLKIIVLLLCSTLAFSQTYLPVPVTGFNIDGIAETSPVYTSTNANLDLEDHVLYSESFGVANNIGYGLKDSRIYVNGKTTFQLEPFNQNNICSISWGQTHTLTFATPGKYTSLKVLGFGTHGAASLSYTVNFSDGTTFTGNGGLSDWFYANPYVVAGIGRINRSETGGTYDGQDPRLYNFDIVLSGNDRFKNITNVTFYCSSSAAAHILAISGTSDIVNDAGQCGAVVNYSLPNGAPALPKVLVLASDYVTNSTDVKNKIAATNKFSVVDLINTNSTTPTLATLQNYQTVFLYTNLSPQNPTNLGNVVAQYIDGGGGVVDAIFTTVPTWGVQGAFNTSNYLVINPGNRIFGSQRTLGNVLIPSHPIMSGVGSFNGGSSSYRSDSSTFTLGSYRVANYDNGELFVVAKENVGSNNAKRVSLNLFPVSNDISSDYWISTTDGGLLMANALNWVANPYTQTAGLPSGSVFPLGTTTNTFTYYDSNGVQQTYSFTINVIDAQAPIAITKNITATLNAAGTVTILPADVNNGSTDNCSGLTFSLDKTTFNCTNVGANTVNLTVTDAAGNIATASAVVTIQNSLVITPTPTNVLCHGTATGSATVSVTGGTTPFTYSWSSGGTGATEAGLAAGTYTVTVTDGNGCFETQSFTITEPSTSIAATAGPQTNVLCHGTSTGSATVNVTGGTGAYTYSWSPSGGTAATATGLGAGTYTVTVKDANLCEITQSFTIIEPTTSLVATAGPQTNVLCYGNATGSATVNATGGTGAYTYSWSPSGGTAATATGLTAGTYTVTVKDANLCTTTQSFSITEPVAALTATAGPQTNVLCYGNATGSATVNVTGGTGTYTYSWSPSGGTAATATGLTAGTYTVTVTDANLCTTTQSFIITEPVAALTATAGPQTNVLCHGNATGSATVNVTGGTGAYTYSWSPSGGTAATATGLGEGTYTVTVKDANLCETTQSFIITEPSQALTITPNTTQVDVLCYGEATGSATVAVNGGTGIYTYSWNTIPVQTSATATGLIADTYTVTITDANNCTLTESFTITQPSAPLSSVNTKVDVLCHGNATGTATVSISGGTGAYTYLWNNGQTSATATGLIAGIYTVTITDANNCILTESFTITQPGAPLSSVNTKVDVLCHGNATGSATVNVTGGTGAYTYLWDNGQTTATATGLIAGNYTVTVTDANNCTITESFTIAEPAQPLSLTPNTTQVNVSCFGGTNGSATVAVNGGTGTYTYLWSNGQTTATATSLIAGDYDVTVTDANGCTITQSFTITEPPVLEATAGNQVDVSCFGGSNAMATVNVTGGTGAYTYSWNTIPVQTTATASGLKAGTYIVMVKDANLCETTQSFTITQPDILTAVITTDNVTDVLCFGAATGTTTVTVTGGTQNYTYQWNTVPVQTTATATGLKAGTYTVIVTDAKGCTANATVTITQPATALKLTTSQINVTCYGGNDGQLNVVATGGVGPYTYEWTPAVSTSNIATGLTTGNYKVVVTDANGCIDLRYLNVTSPTELKGTINFTDIVCNGETDGTASVTATGGVTPYTYLWSNGSTTSSVQNLSSGTYSVVVTDAHNCTFTTSINITQPQAIVITSQPVDVSVTSGESGSFTVVAQNATHYQWQMSLDGGITWTNVTDGGAQPKYTGSATSKLSLGNIRYYLNGSKFRVIVSLGGSCQVISTPANLTVAPLLELEDIAKLSMSVYPNPASTEVFVTIPDYASHQNLKVAVYDLNGRLVRNEQPITSDNYKIDVTGLESAVYIITITSDKGKTDKKIVVNKIF